MKMTRRKIIVGLGGLGALGAWGLAGGPSHLGSLFVKNEGLAEKTSHPSVNDFLDFHRSHFLDLEKNLTESEKNFLREVKPLAEKNGYQIRDDFFYSSFTFSHRFENNRLNQSRFAIGSFTHADKIPSLAAPLLAERGIALDPIFETFPVAGVGWDLELQALKIYAQIPDFQKLTGENWRELWRKAKDHPTENFGLISMSYQNSKVIERKIYLPLQSGRISQWRRAYSFGDDIVHINLMITDERGVVPQLDLKAENRIDSAVNEKGREVMGIYRQWGVPLDTITYDSPEKFTFYFG